MPMPIPPDARSSRVVETVYALLFAAGVWPRFSDLDRFLDHRGEPDTQSLLLGMPAGLLYGVSPDRPALLDEQEIALSVAGLVACAQAAADLGLFLEIVRFAAQLEQAIELGEPYPALSSDSIARGVSLPAAGRAQTVARLGEILRVENWGYSTASRDGPNWRFQLDRRVRRLRGVTGVQDYWDRTRAEPRLTRQVESSRANQIASSPEEVPAEGSRTRHTVFVSWSHSERGWNDREKAARRDLVDGFVGLLRGLGVDADVDLYHSHEAVDWTRWGPKCVAAAERVLVIVTPSWRAAWEGTADPCVGTGAAAEADALKSLYERNRDDFNERVRLVFLPGASSLDVPQGLHRLKRFEIATVDDAGVSDLLRDLTDQAQYPRPPLGEVPRLPPSR
jgi:hypothetical protein